MAEIEPVAADEAKEVIAAWDRERAWKLRQGEIFRMVERDAESRRR